nr:hypothetical protein [Tanacetum cinerariifolium]
MAPLTFSDTHNMVAYLPKSDATATAKKVNDAVQLRALIDSKKVVVLEAIIRRDLHLDDADGVECLSNEEIFEDLIRMSTKFNFSKYIFDGMVRNVDSPSKFLIGCIQTRGKIASIDANEDVTLEDVEKDEEVVPMDTEPQGRDKQKKADMEGAIVLQRQYDDKGENIHWSAIVEQVQEKHLDSIKKYQNLKKKPVSIAKARKNMIIYLKNMAGYKMEFFRGMTYDRVRPIFEIEYKKVQTFFKPDKDVEEPKKKRVANEALFQECFKKLKAAEVSGSESAKQIPSNDPKEMTKEDVHNIVYWKIIRVRGITKAYQVFEDMLKGFDREDLVALWNLVKKKFSSAMSSKDKEKALWVELKRLFKPDADDVLWKLQRYMHAPLT